MDNNKNYHPFFKNYLHFGANIDNEIQFVFLFGAKKGLNHSISKFKEFML